MTNNAHAMYNLSLDQLVNLIKVTGHQRTVLVQGEMGTGKSSILKMLDTLLPGHLPVYFDATTKDLGDIMIPKMKEAGEQDYVTFATNEELGLHLQDTPTILMIDEYGKANPAVKNALLRLMQERQIASYKLHPQSIVFATTNLGAEGVGDILPPHARNRIRIVTSRKPTHMEWIEYGINNNVDHSLLGWVRDNPQVFQSFLDVNNPDDNPYIFHPRAVGRTSFVTPRSLESASDLLKSRDFLDDQTLTAALIGTVGDRAAMDMMAYVRLADDLPKLAQIKANPETAPVPKSAAAVCMVVYRTLASLEPEWLDQWMIFLDRLSKEAQGLFANGVRRAGYKNQGVVMTHKGFTDWARKNDYLFASDKK